MELEALVRSLREKGDVHILHHTTGTNSSHALLRVPTAVDEGAEELERRAGEGRRILYDLEGPIRRRIPDVHLIPVQALHDEKPGPGYVKGDRAVARPLHDKPMAQIILPDGRFIYSCWPCPDDFSVVGSSSHHSPIMGASDGSGPRQGCLHRSE